MGALLSFFKRGDRGNETSSQQRSSRVTEQDTAVLVSRSYLRSRMGALISHSFGVIEHEEAERQAAPLPEEGTCLCESYVIVVA